MENKALCAICGEGHVTAQTREVETDYKGTKALLPMHYQLCDTCTSDYAGMVESKLNKRIVMAFRKQVDGLLTGDEITALRKHYQLTQAQGELLAKQPAIRAAQPVHWRPVFPAGCPP